MRADVSTAAGLDVCVCVFVLLAPLGLNSTVLRLM